MAPVWFHVVPIVVQQTQTLVFLQQNHHCRRGSCVVPCGSSGVQQTQLQFSLSKTIIAGVVPAWFHVVPIVVHRRKPLFLLSKTFIAGVVPAWFHVVPTVVQQTTPQFLLSTTVIAGVAPAWFHVVPTVVQQPKFYFP